MLQKDRDRKVKKRAEIRAKKSEADFQATLMKERERESVLIELEKEKKPVNQ